MNEGKDDNDFNEPQTRELVDYLLENDIPIFKNLINEIKGMDSHSFTNLFQGIPFKSPENANGFEYKVRNKKSFEELLKKFDNFYEIINSWYPDKKYYPYIKQLWENYIGIKHLARMNENKREELLNSYDIDYKNWPKDIQKEFIKVIAPSRHKRISEKEFEKIKELSEEFKNLFDEMNKFKEEIEDKPEMIVYKKNNDELIKKSEKGLIDTYGPKILTFIGMITSVGSMGGFEFINNNDNYDNNSDFYDFLDDWDSYDDYDDLNQSSEIFNQGNFDFKLCAYTIASFIHLGWTVYEFYNYYNDMRDIKNNIKGDNGYEKKLKEIEKNFKAHKDKIGILPDDFKESLKKISEVLEEIHQDYNELKNLINNINKDIATAEKHENKSTIGLIASVGLAIGGALITKNPNPFWYGTSLVSNVASGICNSIVLVDSIGTKKKLKKILTKAEEQEKEIKAGLENMIKLLSEIEKGRLEKISKKIKPIIKLKTKKK